MATSKYNEIEIQTAKNLLKKGLKWIARNQSGRLSAHVNKPSKVGTYWWSVGISDCTCDYVPIFQNIRFEDKEPTSLESIVHPPILDDAERRYLSAVIRPFRNQIISIYKEQFGFNHESIIIEYYDFDRSQSTLCLPQFEKGSMYNGMKIGKAYTLEELGL